MRVVAIAQLALLRGLGALQLGLRRLQLGLGSSQIGGRSFRLRLVLVEAHLREGLTHAEFLRTLQIAVGFVLVSLSLQNGCLGLSDSGLRLGYLGLGFLNVQLHDCVIDARQQLPFLHLAAVIHPLAVRINAELLDLARHLCTHIHQLLRLQRSRGLYLIQKGRTNHLIRRKTPLRSFTPIVGHIRPYAAGSHTNDQSPFIDSFHVLRFYTDFLPCQVGMCPRTSC